jgi:hypothetical protein
VRKNLIRPDPVAFPARLLKKSAAVSTTHLLSDGRGDPLIQGDAIFLRQAFRSFLDRDRQL